MMDGKYCMLCGNKTHIECGHCGHVRVNDQYTQVEVQWTNGSKMMIGLCVDCANKNAHQDPQIKAKITELHQAEWDRAGHRFDREVVIA